MGVSVNPPPQIKLPDKILNDDELRPLFLEILENQWKLWLRSGGGTDMVEQAGQYNSRLAARIIDIEQRLGSGDPFTADETGFTADSTKITADRTETG